MSQVIQAKQVAVGFHNAVSFLQKKQDVLNHMNVFPVADQDTGNNMLHSMRMAADHLPESGSPARIFSVAYENLLRYSHGNSGTILTLFFEGFSESLNSNSPLTGCDLALAFRKGADRAYQGVSSPMDGTLLSVAKQSADAGMSLLDYTDDAGKIWERITMEAFAALPFTALRNPVLKKHQVIDSGAYGLCIILDAFLSSFYPEAAPREYPEEALPVETPSALPTLNYRYCTEMVLGHVSADQAHNLRHELAHLGDSFLMVHKNGMTKIHIHTNNPELVLLLAENHGVILSRKVDDMASQILAEEESEEFSLLVCCQEEEQQALFASLGATVIATKNGFCLEASELDVLLQKPFSLYSSLSPVELEVLFSKTGRNLPAVTYRDDDLTLAELFLN